MIVSSVVQQHVDDAGFLAAARKALTQAAYPKLPRLLRADRRLAAHLDGLRIAGESGQPLVQAALESPSSGAVFTAAVGLLERRDNTRLDQLLALAETVAPASDGLLYALGWVDRSHLEGTISRLFDHGDQFSQLVGMAACAMHRVDAQGGMDRLLTADNPAARARAFRTLGELGSGDALPTCIDAARNDSDPNVQFWAAWSAVLLGDRESGLEPLTNRALAGGEHRLRALRLALQAMSMNQAHSALQHLAGSSQHMRWLIQGSGIGGDVQYVPWLIRHMKDLKTARPAGEAFALITGADLPHDALDRPAPQKADSGPTDDPDDPNVDMDPDDTLPWPDADKIAKWWAANESRFQKGQRYFMGKGVTREHCINVLKTGYQRQRIFAAHYLCLLTPGTPLFNTSAPAWRQQRLLATM